MNSFLKLHAGGKMVIIRIDDVVAVVPADEGTGSEVYVDGDTCIDVDETIDQIVEIIEDMARDDRMGM